MDWSGSSQYYTGRICLERSYLIHPLRITIHLVNDGKVILIRSMFNPLEQGDLVKGYTYAIRYKCSHLSKRKGGKRGGEEKRGRGAAKGTIGGKRDA